jgi:acyl-CoA synthetase (AMP-forming)/AMP-acid ligase II
VYEGPNVMMGYALARADLGAGDSQASVLHTGDLGRLRHGFLYLAGRADRQVKVLGRRVDLEQVELLLAGRGVTAAVTAGPDERLLVVVENAAQEDAGQGNAAQEDAGQGNAEQGNAAQGNAGQENAAQRHAAAQCRVIAARLGFPSAALAVVGMKAIPRTPHGKLDYPALNRALEQNTSGFVRSLLPTRGPRED